MKPVKSLKPWRAKLAEPPDSGNIAVPSAYDRAVNTKMMPAKPRATGVAPAAARATTPRA